MEGFKMNKLFEHCQKILNDEKFPNRRCLLNDEKKDVKLMFYNDDWHFSQYKITYGEHKNKKREDFYFNNLQDAIVKYLNFSDKGIF